jgi:hypothetical protein
MSLSGGLHASILQSEGILWLAGEDRVGWEQQ